MIGRTGYGLWTALPHLLARSFGIYYRVNIMKKYILTLLVLLVPNLVFCESVMISLLHNKALNRLYFSVDTTSNEGFAEALDTKGGTVLYNEKVGEFSLWYEKLVRIFPNIKEGFEVYHEEMKDIKIFSLENYICRLAVKSNFAITHIKEDSDGDVEAKFFYLYKPDK